MHFYCIWLNTSENWLQIVYIFWIKHILKAINFKLKLKLKSYKTLYLYLDIKRVNKMNIIIELQH